MISQKLKNKILEYEGWNEENKKLHPEIIEIIEEEKLFKLFLPSSLQGLNWPLPKIIDCLEEIAILDANVAWVINLIAGANMFAGYFNPSLLEKINIQSHFAFAGSGAISGKAFKTKKGYKVEGYWKYASGAAHANYFTANCWLYDEDAEIILDSSGKPLFTSFIFDKKEVQVLDTWETLGLRASSSHDFKIENVEVPKYQTFDLTKASTWSNAAIMSFPFATLAVINMSAMIIGIAKGFLKEWENTILHKIPLNASEKIENQAYSFQAYTKVKEQFQQEHDKTKKILEEVWTEQKENGSVRDENLKLIENQYQKCNGTCYDLVTTLYPLAGMNVVFQKNRLNKIFRDFMTATQHYLVHPQNRK